MSSSDKFVRQKKSRPSKSAPLAVETKLGNANPAARSSFAIMSKSGKCATDAAKKTAVAEVRQHCGQNEEEVMCRGTKMI